MKSILIASPDTKTCEVIQNLLQGGYRIQITDNLETCLQVFQKKRQEFTFVDVTLIHQAKPQIKYQVSDYQKLLNRFYKFFPAAPIIILSPLEHIRGTVQAVRAGAVDYLTYPFDSMELQYVMENVHQQIQTRAELDDLRAEFWKQEYWGVVRSNSKAMQQVFKDVEKVAPTTMTVLIVGETGTGKGIIAKLIHEHSIRCDKPFIHVHCGAIPDSLLESELFGHEKGAFTHAIQRKLGKFEIAHGGTIFLDEVGTMTHSAQVKLLQVLQDKIFQRVGGTVDIKTDVRVIAASNANLKQLSEEGSFRSDLYYRLNVFSIVAPPLRERAEDISLLTEEFLQRFNQKYDKVIKGFHPDVLEAFRSYHWPGNIRELENLIERAYILEKTSFLTPESLPSDLFTIAHSVAEVPLKTSFNLAEARNHAVESFERQYLKELLAEHHGKVNLSAQMAGITSRQLHRMLAKYSINKDEFKNKSIPPSSPSPDV
ncbi:MAG: sigma-54-dependent Fis family transcriptional regulator [SAR324 cluster bacterium]|nr:sigma-54-dependent Fis family transcriptional regulator [SAR324 cluster bacterium]